MIIAGTGHRPGKLGGYSDAVDVRLVGLAYNFINGRHVDGVISGMALGWDQALATAAIRLEIPVTAAIPFPGQENLWFDQQQERYHSLLSQCHEVVTVSPVYDPRAFQARNKWMVDRCDLLLALWDGSSGGTYGCVQYAKNRFKPWLNLWSMWEKSNA